MRYFNLGKRPGTIQGGKVPIFYNNIEGVYQDPFGHYDEEDGALHNPAEDEEAERDALELAQQYEEEEDEDYIFNREVLGALQEAGIDQEDWEYWMDEFLPTRLGENYTVDQLDEFLENRRRFDEKMARDNERYDLKRKRDEDDDSDYDDSDYDDDFMSYGQPTGHGIGGGTIEDVDPFEEPNRSFGLQTGATYLPPEIVRHIGSFRPEGERVIFPLEEPGQMRGVQAGASYLPPEIVRHIGSFRPQGGDENLFETSTEGTRTRSGIEVSSPGENRSRIMHELLSLDDDFFQDEEERAPNYNRVLRTLIKKAGEIRNEPHFDRRYWTKRIRSTGGSEMPAKMPGSSEYLEFRSNLNR